jgi:multidrug efflux pump subunit AcrB
MESELAGGNYEASHFGSHKAEVHIEVAPSQERKITSQQIADLWREAVGDIPGVSEVGFSASIFSTGKPISIRLSGANLESLLKATEELKGRLMAYPGVQDISDTFKLGKREWILRIKPEAEPLGLTQSDLARQVRQAFYGEEVQRFQRNRDEVKVMVRYPVDDRRSPEDVRQLRIRLADGREVPFDEVATVDTGRGYASIRRVDGRRSVTVTADIDIGQSEPDKVVAGLRENDMPKIISANPGVMADFKGSREEQELAMESLVQAYFVAMVMIYGLLAIPFKSYVQPFIVMCAIPFGLIGAVLGHLIMGIELTILSMFGVVALTGVVVNDSLVMVDFVNRNRSKYDSLLEAVRISGVARFRAIWLTSLTTFAGLTPLVFFEKSVQAQFLIPMAVSLGFGVMFATVVTLVLVPSLYMILEDVRNTWNWLYGKNASSESTASSGSLASMGR